jgi:hypothetical protein
MPAPYWVDQNSRYARCVDGRPVGAIIARQCGRWMVMRRGTAAQRDLGPQFPGASLLFVRLLQDLAGQDPRRAFDLTERASSRAGLRCAFHVDDSGGRHAIAALDDTALLALAASHHSGCGFAQETWKANANAIVSEARRRGWRMYISLGGRVETGATINAAAGSTFDTSRAALDGAAAFNLDLHEARRVFDHLESLLGVRGFSAQAEEWLTVTYSGIVTQLGAISAPSEVVLRR